MLGREPQSHTPSHWPHTSFLGTPRSIRQIECCLEKMQLIYKQFRKAKTCPGEFGALICKRTNDFPLLVHISVL